MAACCDGSTVGANRICQLLAGSPADWGIVLGDRLGTGANPQRTKSLAMCSAVVLAVAAECGISELDHVLLAKL